MTKTKQSLPPGIWYEPARKRYRVRLYRKSVVFHRSYHKTLTEAKRAYNTALAEVRMARRRFTPVEELLRTFKDG